MSLPSDMKWDHGRELPRGTPLIARLWHKSTHERTGCFHWRGGHDDDGYGNIFVDGKHTKVHLAAYRSLVGPVPGGLVIDHLCRNRACWNPEHLEPVTVGENNMRSPSAFSAVNARKTHCTNGHALEGDNLRIGRHRNGNVRRWCITCREASNARWNAQRRRGAAPVPHDADGGERR